MAVQRLDQLVAMHNPLVHKLKGRVVRDQRGITVGKVTIPHHLQGKFERRCEGYDSIQKAVREKDIRLHGKPTERGPYWFAVVSGEFRPIAVREVSDALGKVSSGVEVRFGVDDDFQLQSAYALAEQISYYAGRLKSARMRAEDEAGRLMMDGIHVLAPYVK